MDFEHQRASLIDWLIDWVKVSRPTRHKIGHLLETLVPSLKFFPISWLLASTEKLRTWWNRIIESPVLAQPYADRVGDNSATKHLATAAAAGVRPVKPLSRQESTARGACAVHVRTAGFLVICDNSLSHHVMRQLMPESTSFSTDYTESFDFIVYFLSVPDCSHKSTR